MATIIKDQFKITIERITLSEFPSETEILVEERHYTDEEIDKNYISRKDSMGVEYTKKIYGKKDTIARREDKEKVFEQIVDAQNLNIRIVIGAINNGIPTPIGS